MPKVWQVAPKVSDDIISRVLLNRGLKSKKDKAQFFNPKLADYKKELKIPSIPQVIKRINRAIKNKELILVFGDYDVDGICGAAILYLGLTQFGAKVLPYIPHREKEGYGLSKLGLDYAKEVKASLVITVDCGIVAFEQADYAKRLGLDLIITDHHQKGEKEPDALAIVHSIKMAGSAVAWCLVNKLIGEKEAVKLLDLVAIATICDLVPLVGLNRFFVKKGLELLNKTQRVGFLALLSECSLRLGGIDTFHIGFVLGPRLNALGRLEHAMDALRLLCTKDILKAKRLSKLLCEANDRRQKLTLDAIVQAKDLLSSQSLTRDKKILVLHSKDWLPGIIGLVAGRISEEYGISTIAISEGEIESKGSARSVDGLDMVETIRKCKSILIDVGGHKSAAGFTIKTAKIVEFERMVEEVVVAAPSYQPTLTIDVEVELWQLNKRLVEEIEKLKPFGIGNPQPIFASFDVVIDNLRTVGDGKHLKFNVGGIDGIGFGMGDLYNLINNKPKVNLAYSLELDRYNGMERLRLKVKDLKIV